MYDNMRKIQYPKISVITVVKNGMPYIEDSLNSFHYQKYKIKELIVICSKSFDGTEKFLRKNKKKIDKLIFDNKSLNKYQAINLGIKKASGDLIGILHSDYFFTKDNEANTHYFFKYNFSKLNKYYLQRIKEIKDNKFIDEQIIFKGKIGRIRDIKIHKETGELYMLSDEGELWRMYK